MIDHHPSIYVVVIENSNQSSCSAVNDVLSSDGSGSDSGSDNDSDSGSDNDSGVMYVHFVFPSFRKFTLVMIIYKLLILLHPASQPATVTYVCLQPPIEGLLVAGCSWE